MQEQVRKNFATFERALGLFSPFSTASSDGSNAHEAGAESAEGTAGSNSKPSGDEIATLKAELSAMQQRLEQLSRR